MPQGQSLKYDAMQTAKLLPFPDLVSALEIAVREHSQGKISAPERQVVPFPHGGVMLSMPATAADIGVHKLVNVVPTNRRAGLPTIHGIVAVYDSATGQDLFILDGPTVTARRTAALSMLGLRSFLASPPSHITLFGTGTQAMGHLEALAALYPGLDVSVIGRTPEKAQELVDRVTQLPIRVSASQSAPPYTQAVITLTTSVSPVYTEAARTDRLIIGVGAFKPELAEISAQTLSGSVIYVDDPAGARHEAGDLIQADIDWQRVQALAAALEHGRPPDAPVVYKTVGCAAWDLAAARCAMQIASRQSSVRSP